MNGRKGPWAALASGRQTDRQTDPLCLRDRSLWVLCSGDAAATTRHRPRRKEWPQLPRPGPSRTGARLLSGGLRPLAQARGSGRACSSEAGPGCWDGRGGAAGCSAQAAGRRRVWTGVDRWGQQIGPPGPEGLRGLSAQGSGVESTRPAPPGACSVRPSPGHPLRPGRWPSHRSPQLGAPGTGRSMLPAPETRRRNPFTSPLATARSQGRRGPGFILQASSSGNFYTQ